MTTDEYYAKTNPIRDEFKAKIKLIKAEFDASNN